MREMCRALDFAHGQSIIHRDLKPSNIIVNQNNIAKAIDQSGDTITQLGGFVGTQRVLIIV